METETKEVCSKRFCVTPALFNKINGLLDNHKTANDILTEMYDTWVRVHHIKEDTDGKES
jgi:hypothetical protein